MNTGEKVIMFDVTPVFLTEGVLHDATGHITLSVGSNMIDAIELYDSTYHTIENYR